MCVPTPTQAESRFSRCAVRNAGLISRKYEKFSRRNAQHHRNADELDAARRLMPQ